MMILWRITSKPAVTSDVEDSGTSMISSWTSMVGCGLGWPITSLERSVSLVPWRKGRTLGELVVWFPFHLVGTRPCEAGADHPGWSLAVDIWVSIRSSES